MGEPGHQRDLASHDAAVAQRRCAPLVTGVFGPTIRIKLAREAGAASYLTVQLLLFATELHRKLLIMTAITNTQC